MFSLAGLAGAEPERPSVLFWKLCSCHFTRSSAMYRLADRVPVIIHKDDRQRWRSATGKDLCFELYVP